MLHHNVTPGGYKEIHNSEPDQLMRVAILAQTYGCMATVRYTLQATLDNKKRHTLQVVSRRYHLAAQQNLSLAAAAKVLGHAEYFRSFTRRVVLDSTTQSLQELKHRHREDAIAISELALDLVGAQLSQIRKDLKSKLIKLIDDAAFPIMINKDIDEPLPLSDESIAKLHITSKSWPLRFKAGATLRAVLCALHHHGNLEVFVQIGPLLHRIDIKASELREIVQDLSVQASGLCLECVQIELGTVECTHDPANPYRLAAEDSVYGWPRGKG